MAQTSVFGWSNAEVKASAVLEESGAFHRACRSGANQAVVGKTVHQSVRGMRWSAPINHNPFAVRGLLTRALREQPRLLTPYGCRPENC
jgi:hypothetical protein